MSIPEHEGWDALRRNEAGRIQGLHGRNPRVSLIDRWCRDVDAMESPCMDSALDIHTATIWRLHEELGLDEPRLP